MALYNYKTANPAFSREVWKGYTYSSNKMTVNGIFIKSLFCLTIVITSTYLTFEYFNLGIFTLSQIFYTGLACSIFFSLIIAFIHKIAPLIVPIYSTSLGILFGAVAIYSRSNYEGIPFQTIGISIATFLVVLVLYKLQIVKFSERFKSVVAVAISIIIGIYIMSWILQSFKITSPFLLADLKSYLLIVLNILISALATFTILLDFDFIERKKNHVPSYMEWVATWGLLVAIIWSYVEAFRFIKRLFFK